MKIIAALEKIRENEGMSFAELSRRSGKSRSFLNDMRKRADIQVSTACSLAEALNCELVLRSASGDEIIITSEQSEDN